MSSRGYGIYQQGAIFHYEDFDPAKVITTVFEKCMETTVPENIRKALADSDCNTGIITELCDLLDISFFHRDGIKAFSDISNILVAEAERDEWFIGSEPLMGTDHVEVLVYSDIEGEYVYAGKEKEDNQIEDCFIFSLSFPKVWDIEEHKGIRTKEEAVQAIREAAKPLIKDNIDWSKRLGFLIGSSYG
jgi:hypothetical protein